MRSQRQECGPWAGRESSFPSTRLLCLIEVPLPLLAQPSPSVATDLPAPTSRVRSGGPSLGRDAGPVAKGRDHPRGGRDFRPRTLPGLQVPSPNTTYRLGLGSSRPVLPSFLGGMGTVAAL